MREKLIDLLYEAEGLTNNEPPTVEQMVDYLIKKGVTVCGEGRWKGAGLGDYECTHCGAVYSGGNRFKYCPNCRAYMGEPDETDYF